MSRTRYTSKEFSLVVNKSRECSQRANDLIGISSRFTRVVLTDTCVKSSARTSLLTYRYALHQIMRIGPSLHNKQLYRLVIRKDDLAHTFKIARILLFSSNTDKRCISLLLSSMLDSKRQINSQSDIFRPTYIKKRY